MNAIEIKNVSKSYRKHPLARKHQVFEDINLTIGQGEFVILKGKNGTGKTTLINLILGLQKPSSGSIRVFGISPEESISRLNVGCMLQKARVPNHLQVEELIELFRSYYPQPFSTEEILKRVNLEHKRYERASDLSGGQERALYFALAIAGDPDLLILDEPTTNLDSDACSNFWQQVREFAKQGKTVLVITQVQSDLDAISDLATRVLTLENGQVQESLTARHGMREEVNSGTTASKEKALMEYQTLSSFFGQLKAEVIELIRKPFFLSFILAVCCCVVLLEEVTDSPSVLVLLIGVILLLIVLERFSVGVANERTQGWIRLLRVTPLMPGTYLAAKVTTILLVAALGLSLMFALGAFVLGITQPWMILSFVLILGLVPFAVVGFTVGYLFDGKNIPLISTMLFLFFCLSGVPLQMLEDVSLPETLQKLIHFSPSYHYSQLILWASNHPSDGYSTSHFAYLVVMTYITWIIATWVYRRDRATS